MKYVDVAHKIVGIFLIILIADPALAQLRITKFMSNGEAGDTILYANQPTHTHNKAWYQQFQYRNNSNQLATISIAVTGSTPNQTTPPANAIRQGYYISTGRSSDVLSVKVTAPDFNCGTAIQTGPLEVKVFKVGYNKNLFKGELICSNQKIVYELGDPTPFIGTALNTSHIQSHTLTSQQTGFEAIKLFSGVAWKSGNTKNPEKLKFLFHRPARVRSISTTIRRNMTRITFEGKGADSFFNFFQGYSYIGAPPADLAVLPLRDFSKWHVAPRIDELTIDVTKVSAGTVTEINKLTIITENYSAWKNHTCPEDVNGDGRISSLDALKVINYLNSDQNRVLPTVRIYNDYLELLDVNGDGAVSSIDALTVINALNAGKRNC